ncbi:hypothetical protein StrepF001_08330 [Streptomyces sp. F001]|uniref:hypothetical protein n=1 Tax=Streptomyces sp. F001 TaxID=1510026 RepID=UPI00101E54FB|nr:hypothetical protein [Streptomyces sp. F001]RZB18931.1 hypothetical protein StrepF001_08330 [Streptomyces sp. F001]
MLTARYHPIRGYRCDVRLNVPAEGRIGVPLLAVPMLVPLGFAPWRYGLAFAAPGPASPGS